MFTVEFYELANGHKPAQEFINSLEGKMRAKAFKGISLLEKHGNMLREPHSSYMGDGVFELRIKFSSDITRVFYFFVSGKRIILTNGFVKKSKKTPRAEFDLAKKYKLDYERRNLL